MSRRVTANLFTTLDGAVENPSSWQGDAFDEILGEVMTETLSSVDDVLLGRETYDFWASHWTREDVEDPFKSFINPVAKHVASRTLKQKDVTWENCSVIDGDLMDFVRGLKGTQGRDISIQGSLSIIAQLLEAGLLDRLTLFRPSGLRRTGTPAQRLHESEPGRTATDVARSPGQYKGDHGVGFRTGGAVISRELW